MSSFTSTDQIFALARRLWGGAWVIVLIATINSSLAVSIAVQNATIRVMFDMGRVKALPSMLGRLNARWKTPWNAIWFMTGVTLILGLGVGAWLGPVATFGMIGIMQTLGLIIVYSMGNIGVLLFYGRERRSSFNIWLHGLVPIATTVALGFVFYETVIGLHPFNPANDNDYAPLIVIIWTVVGVAVMAYSKASGNDGWLMRAGQSADLRKETRDELLHRPAL